MSFIYRYLRHSDEVSQQPNSRLAQLNQINHWIERERGRNPEFAKLQDTEEFWDANCSGGIAIAKRTAGGLMMGRIKSGDVIIAAKWDRMFRDGFDFEDTIIKLRKAKVRLVCVEFDVDTDSPDGMLMARVIIAVAIAERMKGSARTKAGLGVIKHTHGVRLAPLRPPTGWKHARKHHMKRKDGQPYAILVPDWEQRRECEEIVKLVDEGKMSFSKVAQLFQRNHRKISVTGLTNWKYYHISERYKKFKAGFPTNYDYTDGQNRDQLMIAVQQ